MDAAGEKKVGVCVKTGAGSGQLENSVRSATEPRLLDSSKSSATGQLKGKLSKRYMRNAARWRYSTELGLCSPLKPISSGLSKLSLTRVELTGAEFGAFFYNVINTAGE